MTNQQLASTLTEHLELRAFPVGVQLVQEPPSEMPQVGEGIPSTCTMWRRAEAGPFYAPAQRHFNCPVGAHVMGFDLPQETQSELMTLVGAMAEAEYFDPAEAAGIPRISPAPCGAIYGRLDALVEPPDLVLCWVGPVQAMLAAEAVGTSLWSGEAGMKVLGRPGCASLPMALIEGRTTLSLGCAGMRVYTEVADGAMLLVLPWAEAEKLAAELPRVAAANRTITGFHEQRKATIASSAE